MGLQSLLYYAALSWLPTILRDRGASADTAGNLLALMGVGNLAVSFLVPMVAQRMRAQHVLVVPTVAAMALGLAGVVYLPLGSAVAWVLILGAGQNAALSLAIFFTMARAPHPAAAASLSALAQSVGYLLASAGPLELGLLHSATGSAGTCRSRCCFALNGVLLVAGLLAARDRELPAASTSRARRRSPAAAPVGFDLDMTLIDSRRVILASFAALSDATGVPIDPAAVDRRLGIKLEDELGFWFPAEQVPAAVRVYREHYLRLAGPLTSALPGAREALAAVKAAGARAVVITAKHEITARLSLDLAGLVPDEPGRRCARAGEGGGAHRPGRGGLRRRYTGGHGRRGSGRSARGRRDHGIIYGT